MAARKTKFLLIAIPPKKTEHRYWSEADHGFLAADVTKSVWSQRRHAATNFLKTLQEKSGLGYSRTNFDSRWENGAKGRKENFIDCVVCGPFAD